MKNLIIILAETRACDITFNNIKENLIDILDADLCICIGVKPDYNYDNMFYKSAKYKFLFDEPTDYSEAFENASNIIKNENNLYNNNNSVHWKEFLKIKDQFMGGIKDQYNQHSGSGGILIFFRWFLLQNLIKNNLLEEYDRFIITRSDYIYKLPHPKLELLNEKFCWIPDEEHYGGFTDRHVILSKYNIVCYLNILNSFVINSNNYFIKMKEKNNWNLERLIKFHLTENNMLDQVKHFPYIMYSVRALNGTTSWSIGFFSVKYNYFIKYMTEYDKSEYYKKLFIKLGIDINTFYTNCINNKYINIDPEKKQIGLKYYLLHK